MVTYVKKKKVCIQGQELAASLALLEGKHWKPQKSSGDTSRIHFT